MNKLPREIWIMILDWKSKFERRERIKKASISLSLNLKRPQLIDYYMTTGDEIMTTCRFRAGGLLIVEYTTMDNDLGFIINVITSIASNDELPVTLLWISAIWSSQYSSN